MRQSVCGLVLFLLGGIAVAQNASPAFPKQQHTSVPNDLFSSDRERLQWEAAETWSHPAIPNIDQRDDHPIHIDVIQQSPLTVPKLRREWLQSSTEAAGRSRLVPKPFAYPAD